MTALISRNKPILLAYVSLVLLVLLTAAFSPGFLSESSLRSTVVLAAFVGIVAIGQSFVIFGGGIDLSIPWVLNAAAMMMTFAAAGNDAALAWVIPVVLVAGAGAGLINGIGIAVFKVPAIIMTLATNIIIQGLVLVSTGGAPSPSAPAFIQFMSVGRIGGFPVIAILWLVLIVLTTIALSKTAFGRHLYAVGSSANVAEHSGLPITRTVVLTYVISGVTAALAGMLLTGYSRQAYLGMGDTYLFTSIAAVALGGASILGGNGHYIGTVAGALVLTVLGGLLPALNLSSGALLIVYGGIILVTVAISSEAMTNLIALFGHGRRKQP